MALPRRIKMTPAQEERFRKLGCVSRSLIKLCELEGYGISITDYCATFEHLFINQTDRYGELEDSNFQKIADSLPLPKNRIYSADYWSVKKYFDLVGKRVLGLSKINLNKGAIDIKKHCSVILRMDQTEFEIWTSSQCGGDGKLILDQNEWNTKQFTALVFQ